MNADYTPTRRTVLATTGTAIAGGAGLAALWPDRGAAADVAMGKLNVSGTNRTLEDAPAAMMVNVSGACDVSVPSPPDKVVNTLEVQIGELAGEIDRVTFEDEPWSRDFSMAGDVYSLSRLSPGDLLPQNPGDSSNINLRVRLKCYVMKDGTAVATDTTGSDATVRLTKTGFEVSVGGEGNVTVEV